MIGTIPETDGVTKPEYCQWYEAPDSTNQNGVCLVVHGLNLDPARMEPVCQILQDMGMHVLLLSLRGHGNNFIQAAGQSIKSARLESFKKVTLNTWLQEFRVGYQIALNNSRDQSTPLYFVGFSLGGLLGPLGMRADPDIRFDKMVLFAPALLIRKKAYLLRMLSPFSRLVIPSKTEEFYRANPGTPIAGYKALFAGIKIMYQDKMGQIDIPTLIFLDKDDEFIPYKAMQELIKQNELHLWTMHAVTKDPGVNSPVKHHLVIDEASVGWQSWQAMRKKMQNHLAG